MCGSLSNTLCKLCVFQFPSSLFCLFLSSNVFSDISTEETKDIIGVFLFFASFWKKIIILRHSSGLYCLQNYVVFTYFEQDESFGTRKINAVLFSDFSCMFLHALEGECTFVLRLENALFSCNSFRNMRQRYCMALVFGSSIDYRCEMKIFNG